MRARSLNHRFLDVVVSTPGAWAFLEEPVKAYVRGRLRRGHIEIGIFAQDFAATGRNVRIRRPVLAQYWQQLQELQQLFGEGQPPSLTAMLQLPEVVSVEEPAAIDTERVWRAVEPVVAQALDALVAMRAQEGRHIWADMEARLARMEELLTEVDKLGAAAVATRFERMRERVQGLLTQLGVPELAAGNDGGAVGDWQRRLAQELALWAERSDITEELVRLRSHMSQLRRLAGRDAGGGREMEFLLREMDREASTAASKVSEAEAVHRLVEVKAELARLREQVQNIE